MTLRKLSIEHHGDVLKLFGDNVKDYYFLIDDLIRNNYEGEYFHIFGEYENGKLVSFMLNNFSNLTYYSPFDRDISVYEQTMNKLTFSKLSGPSHLIEKIIPFVTVKQDTLSYLGVVKSLSSSTDHGIHYVQTDEEIEMQYDLLMSTGEFIDTIPQEKGEYVANERNRLQNTTDRTAYIQVNGEMVASSATIMEGDHSAIIIGVVTNPKYRKMGFGSAVLTGLFQQLLKEGKYPYLFYNNPEARSVYKKLGTTEVCEWRVVRV